VLIAFFQSWYSPEGRYAPLRGGEMVTIGMGTELAFEFTLKDGQLSSSVFLKLFATRIFVELDWIEQTTPPFDPKFEGTGRHRIEKEKFDEMATWNAFTVMLTLTA
jgi:hypothetical protein